MAISKIKLANAESAVALRDDASLHYIGHVESGITENSETHVWSSDATAGLLLTIKPNDVVTQGNNNLNFVCLTADTTTTSGHCVATYALLSEAAAEIPVLGVTLNGDNIVDSSTKIANVVINPDDVTVVTVPTPANPEQPTPEETAAINAAIATNTLANGVRGVTQSAANDSTLIATTEFVHNVFDEVVNPMVFKGSAEITADDTDPEKCSITIGGTIKKGYTYKITTIYASSGEKAYKGALKVGDTIIADKDSPDVTADWVEDTDWTVIESADDVDVTSVAVGAGLTTALPSGQTAGDPITSTGTINLKLVNGSTALSGSAVAASDTYRTLPVAVDASGNLATAVPAGTLTEVLSGSNTSNAVTQIQNTGSTGTGAGAFLAAHVGTGADDTDTLYIDYITPTTITNAVTYTAS